jgi:hypothetical protein
VYDYVFLYGHIAAPKNSQHHRAEIIEDNPTYFAELM